MKDALVGRQPIFDKDLNVQGYELLFRPTGPAIITETAGDQATSEVILNSVTGIGFDQLIGPHRAFINFTRSLLLNDDPIPLFQRKVVVEVLETEVVDQQLVDGVRHLIAKGYAIALDDFAYHPQWEPLIDLAEIIKIDVLALGLNETRQLVQQLQGRGVKLLAEKVETQEEFAAYLDMRFDYFQGYFFSRPTVVRGRNLPANRLTVLQLLAKLQDPDAEVEEIEKIISQDAAMTYKLLRYINSAAFSLKQSAESIRWAIVLVGLSVVRRLASIVAMSRIDDKPHELLNVAFTRAQMCYLLATTARQKDPDGFYIVGLFSTLDALMDTPMSELLATLPISKDIKDALLYKQGPMGNALACAIAYEECRWGRVAFSNLDARTLRDLYAQASASSFSTSAELLAGPDQSTGG